MFEINEIITIINVGPNKIIFYSMVQGKLNI